MVLIAVVLGIGATAYSQSGVNTVLEAVLFFMAAFCALAVGWVAVWMAFGYSLYDGWLCQQNMCIYHHIADAEVAIKAHEVEVFEHVGGTKVAQSSSLT